MKKLFHQFIYFFINLKKNAVAKKFKTKSKTKNLYDKFSNNPFKISRNKLELFIKCPRCFYINCRFGIKHPSGYPLSLNRAVDTLLKKEFDDYRLKQAPHPICIENNINAIPFKHENLKTWRSSRKGIEYLVPNINLLIHGGIDDIWIDTKTKKLFVVDYKATSKKDPVSLDADWQISYKRQAEIYQWLFRKNGFPISDTAYFVYCNGKKDAERFDKKLDFEISLIPYAGDDSWVSATIENAHRCLKSNTIPSFSENCDYCQYCKNSLNHNC